MGVWGPLFSDKAKMMKECLTMTLLVGDIGSSADCMLPTEHALRCVAFTTVRWEIINCSLTVPRMKMWPVAVFKDSDCLPFVAETY